MMNVLDVPSRSRPVGDRDAAVRALFDREYGSLVRLAVLLVDDVAAAEDAAQEAFARLHRSWDRLGDVERAPAWLRSTVLNIARSGLRRRQAYGRLRPVPIADAASAESRALLSDDRRAVIAALQRLPRRQREVLVLRYYADCSEVEIADALGIAPGSVKSHAHRGLAALREALEDRR
jgi:RNA polymerase sigma-70 factor (sigma-E family)